MIRIIIADTHFGWKQNSVTWMNAQLEFLDKQLIPFLRRQTEPVRLIHLGDVFESRSAINPMVAKAVRERFATMRSLVKDFFIVAGNHDFYSPNNDDVDALTMVFRDMDINLVIKESIYDGDDAFIPWYEYKKPDMWLPANVKNVYTHADIFGEDRKLIGGINIFSGHIHVPLIDKAKGLYNLGSCYSLNFTDSNQERGFYVYDGKTVQFIANKYSIHFWRLRNEEIFENKGTSQDYFELYIDQVNMQKPDYQKRITEIRRNIKNVWTIPQITTHTEGGEDFESYNIEDICKSIVPKRLKNKFKQVEVYLKNTSM